MWVSYVYQNLESEGIGDHHTGALEYKHVWVVRHDGLLFGSGWHHDESGGSKVNVPAAFSNRQRTRCK